MKRLLLLTAIVFSSVHADAEEVEFSIDCKILDQVALEAKDGKSKRYNGIEGRASTGDPYVIKFSLIMDDGYSLTIETEESKLITHSREVEVASPNGNLVSWRDPRTSNSILIIDDSGFKQGEGQIISGMRYYKNDWSFTITDTYTTNTPTISALNCMNVSSEYDRMLEKMIDYHKANKPKYWSE
tara:strand:- start:183 stop:737 length:555 start_codon:yes stop_codon:yes gene_type:complete